MMEKNNVKTQYLASLVTIITLTFINLSVNSQEFQSHFPAEEFKASAGELKHIRHKIMQVAEQVGFSQECCQQIILSMDEAITNIIRHAGRYLALEEAHRAWEVTSDLETVSCYDFAGRFEGKTMTAHPKICPVTGELLFFGYQMAGEPYLTYYRADAAGALVQSENIDIGRAVMMHDFIVTEHYVVFMDLPIVIGAIGPQYKPEEGARLGVMPRNGTNADVKWYEIAPCTVFHPLNAYEEGNNIIIDVCRKASVMNEVTEASAFLYRWTINQDTGHVTETQLDDRSTEFPRVCDSVVGSKHRYGYMAGLAADAPVAERGAPVLA